MEKRIQTTEDRSEDLIDLGAVTATTKGSPKGEAPDSVPQLYKITGFLAND